MTPGSECLDRVWLEAEIAAKPADQGANVGLEGVDEHAMGAEDVTFLLGGLEAPQQ